MEQKQNYFRVNDLAPQNEFSLFFKRVPKTKSDGFVVIDNSEIFLIDGGGKNDNGSLLYLLSLREKWLQNQNDASLIDSKNAKLEIHVIISHPHGDHIGHYPFIFSNPYIRILSVYAPCRSYLSGNVEGAIPSLITEENRIEELLELLQKHDHGTQEIQRIPYGKIFSIPTKNEDTTITIYPSPYDWSEDRGCESEGFGFLKNDHLPVYEENDDLSYTNGILNGNSLWVKIRNKDKTCLITGDQRDSDEMLGSLIRYYGKDEFRCDILKLIHHGDRDRCFDLLDAAKPKIVIFTIGLGLASHETAALCKEMGCDRYYVEDGNLILSFHGDEIVSKGITTR